MRATGPGDLTLLQAQTSRELEVPQARAENDEAIRDAARQFESIFLHQVFKSMRSTVQTMQDEDGLSDAGFGGKIFTDMLDQEYANLASTGGHLGLAELIAQDLGAAPKDGARPASRAGHAHALRAYQRHNAAEGGWLMPVEGAVSSEYGERTLGGHTRMHKGLDFAAPTGTPIRAARGGEVVFAGERGGYGNLVEIDHGDGLTTRYAHASELLVEKGDRVRAGAWVAKVGSTGRSTGPHLHFEIRENGRAKDPADALGMHRAAHKLDGSNGEE